MIFQNSENIQFASTTNTYKKAKFFRTLKTHNLPEPLMPIKRYKNSIQDGKIANLKLNFLVISYKCRMCNQIVSQLTYPRLRILRHKYHIGKICSFHVVREYLGKG